jgi:hypothetical protein
VNCSRLVSFLLVSSAVNSFWFSEHLEGTGLDFRILYEFFTSVKDDDNIF